MAHKTVKGRASYPDQSVLEQVKRDLAKLDDLAADGQYSEASVIIGQDIKAKDVYRLYLNRAATMSDELLSVRQKFERQRQTINLQQLGALVQRLTLNNRNFRNGFRHGEQNFQTYQLIEKAVINLEDAINYWRIANRYRHTYRSSRINRIEDDEVLKVKLETALTAIEALKAIVETREALSKELEEED